LREGCPTLAAVSKGGTTIYVLYARYCLVPRSAITRENGRLAWSRGVLARQNRGRRTRWRVVSRYDRGMMVRVVMWMVFCLSRRHIATIPASLVSMFPTRRPVIAGVMLAPFAALAFALFFALVTAMLPGFVAIVIPVEVAVMIPVELVVAIAITIMVICQRQRRECRAQSNNR